MKSIFFSRLIAGLFLVASLGATAAPDASKQIPVTDATFKCLSDMTPVRGFFVGNLLGKLDDTLKVANSTTGGSYPPGSVIQLVPGEVMVKHHTGWNAATNDWEFFELDVAASGSKIKVRGVSDVKNKFGGNCFECHARAKPEFDLICEKDHGCVPLPFTAAQIAAVQKGDPRCKK